MHERVQSLFGMILTWGNRSPCRKNYIIAPLSITKLAWRGLGINLGPSRCNVGKRNRADSLQSTAQRLLCSS